MTPDGTSDTPIDLPETGIPPSEESIVPDATTSSESPNKKSSKKPHRIRNGCRNAALILLAAAAGSYAVHKAADQDPSEISYEHDGEEFTLDDLTFREKVAQLLHGSAYPNREADIADRVLLNHRRFGTNPEVVNFTDWLSDWLKSSENIGGVHVFRSDARTLDEANRTNIEIMAKSKIPPFISMDIVGGFTRHLGITLKEAKEYGVPDEFMEMTKKSGTELPSQEDIGRAFKILVNKKDYQGQVRFRKQMEQHGAAIARICRDLGIVVNFGPVLDIVEDLDGDQFMEKNDETYGNDPYVVMVLAFHYIKGFQGASAETMIAPKHFTGTGKMPSNPHKVADPGVSTMTPKDGSMLPFKDAISGQLFVDPLWAGHTLDYQIRSLKEEIKYYEKVIANSKKPNKDAQTKLAEKTIALEALYKQYGIDDSFTTMPPIEGLMVGHAQNYMNPDTPGTLSPAITRDRLRHAFQFKGIAFTDDMRMGVIDFHVKNGGGKMHDKGPAERFVRALAVDITIPMILHASGSLDDLVSRVQKAIETREDFDGDGTPDITMDGINERVLQILEQKAKLGLLTKKTIKTEVKCPSTQKAKGPCFSEKTTYKNNSKAYMSGTRAYRSGHQGTRGR